MPTATTPLPDHVRAFLAEPRYATLATTDENGAPRQAVIWYSLDGRLWPTNLRRNPQVSIAVTAADREEWVGITGTVEVVDDQDRAQADIAAMARRYHTRNPAQADDLIENRFQPQQRVSFRVTPTRIHDHLDGD